MELNEQLLQWGVFSFMIGMVLSLPLAAMYYQIQTPIRGIFIVPRKLKSAHLDYIMQAFALGFAYLLGNSLKTEFPLYVVVPLVYGAIMNPTILLLEATPFIHTGFGRIIYLFLRATSPLSLLIAWFFIAFLFLPLNLQIMFLAVIGIGGILFFTYQFKLKKDVKSNNYNA